MTLDATEERAAANAHECPLFLPICIHHSASVRPFILLALCLLATSVSFGLPHVLIPMVLGPDRPYTPFAISGVSSVTYDETATYAALANYTALRLTPPFDTDLWETRNIPVPVTSAPFFAIAAVDSLVGGLDKAFILCDFVLPPIAVLLVYLLILDITRKRRAALVGSFATILISFGPRNFLSVPLLVLQGHTESIVQPLEFSRLLHPELSFTLLAAALLFLWRTLRRGSWTSAIVAGLTGGLLFYTYVYYFPVWFGACASLLLARRWLSQRVWQACLITNLVTWVVSIPFWLSVIESRDTSNFGERLARHYSDLSHMPSPEKLVYDAIYIMIFAIAVLGFLKLGLSRYSSGNAELKRSVLVFHSSIFLAAIAAMNCEVILGFNLESMNHYPNRLFQPYLVLAIFTLLVDPVVNFLSRHFWWSGRTAMLAAGSCVAGMLAIATVRQAVVSFNVADKHELKAEYQLLFDWLNNQTKLDDVVLTSERDLNDLIPVFTHNLVYVPNGERTSASDNEIEQRFLTATRLLQVPEKQVYELLAQDAAHGDPPLGLTYTYFLFVSGNRSYNLGMPEAALRPILTEYRQLDLAHELGRFRLDYIYGRGKQYPAPVTGWTFRLVYENPYGNVWEVARAMPEIRATSTKGT